MKATTSRSAPRIRTYATANVLPRGLFQPSFGCVAQSTRSTRSKQDDIDRVISMLWSLPLAIVKYTLPKWPIVDSQGQVNLQSYMYTKSTPPENLSWNFLLLSLALIRSYGQWLASRLKVGLKFTGPSSPSMRSCNTGIDENASPACAEA